MKYAVIALTQNCDLVEDVHCVEIFDSYDEANDFIKETEQLRMTAWTAKMDYVKHFVDSLDVPPKATYKEWVELADKYKIQLTLFFDGTPNSFRQILRNRLNSKFAKDIEGFNPPPDPKNYQHYIVEIKNEI